MEDRDPLLRGSEITMFKIGMGLVIVLVFVLILWGVPIIWRCIVSFF